MYETRFNSSNLSPLTTTSSFYAQVTSMGWKWKIGAVVTLSAATTYLIYRLAKHYFGDNSTGANPPINPVVSTITQSPAPIPAPNEPIPTKKPKKITTQNSLSTIHEIESRHFKTEDGANLPLAPSVNEEIPFVNIHDWQSESLIIYPNPIITFTKGVSTSIGMNASLLLPGGNAYCHKDMQNLPGCSFLKMYQEPEERLEIYFSDRYYSLRLHAILSDTIGLKCDWKEVDMTQQESSFDYYHGAIVFKDPMSFLFFTRHLCSQSYINMKDFIEVRKKEFPKSSLLDNIFRCNLYYTTMDPSIGEWTKKTQPISKKPGAIFLPPKMHAPGISRIIGAATSLLIPGRTSFTQASLHQDIVYVKMKETGLTLYFPDIFNLRVLSKGSEHAEVTKNGLEGLGLIFTYTDLTQNPFETDFGEYTGSIQCNDPETIVLYLMRICLLRREEIKQLVQLNKLETKQLGKNILSICQRKLAGEENYTIKILMKEDEEISLDRLSINFEKLHSHPIPDLPDEVKDLDVKLKLQKTFDEVGNSILAYADNKSLSQLQDGINKILHVLNGGIYSGVPSGEEGKKFVRKMIFVLKHIFYLLKHIPKDAGMDFKAVSLAQIAIGGMACAGGHVQAILSVYQSLKQFSPLQAHHQADANQHLPQVDHIIVEMIDKELQQFRSAIFQSLAEEYNSKYKGDIAHFKNKILNAIGKKRGIPGAEMADYLDPYAACAPNLTEQKMLQDFDEQYSLEKILEFLSERIRYQGDGVDMGPVFDFLSRHAPVNTDPEDFLINTLNEDGKRLKRTFLIQILIISGHFSYK